MTYCDAHCHLGSRQFDLDRDEMIERMLKARVNKAIMICCSDHDLQRCLELRKRYPSFKLAIGIHPQDLEDEYGQERLERFRETVKELKPDMIGEIGLDYYSHPHTKDQQKHFFIEQLKIAGEAGLPVDIHSRKASNDTYEILKAHPVKGIIHSFSGSIEMARQYMKLGYAISFGASVLFKGAKKPLDVVSKMPLDSLLIETDAPYQSPILDHRHEPADIVKIYEKIAQIREMEIADLMRICEENFDRIFFQST
ncbi:MAG: TatD family hydrolase [Erysipelotrichaceae bacterium]|nr:TatD family hydrolase [Erysipelotrichaceae bacterium]